MKKVMLLLMLFLTSQIYGQMTSFNAKYKVFCVKENDEWGKWSNPQKIDAAIIFNGNEIVITNKNKSYQFFYLHERIGRDRGIDMENNDIYESITYLATGVKGDSSHIAIYKYDSGERALVIMLPKAEHAYFTRKPPKE